MSKLLEVIKRTPQYVCIEDHLKYRSNPDNNVQHIRHIDEGIVILEVVCAKPYLYDAALAFCLHPLVSHDMSFLNNIEELTQGDFTTISLLYAMEFRKTIASWPTSQSEGTPQLSPIIAVNKMIMADIIQHKHTFLTTTPVPVGHTVEENSSNRRELDFYNRWLRQLSIDEQGYRTILKNANL